MGTRLGFVATLTRAFELARRQGAPLLTTGLWELDRILEGVRPGQVWLVTSPPRHGRTSWSAQLGARAAVGYATPTTFLAGVDGMDLMAIRLVAAACNLSMSQARSCDAWPPDVQARLDAVLAAPIEVQARSSTTLEIQLSDVHSRRLLVVDDLDLWSPHPVMDAWRVKQWAATSGGGAILTVPQGVATSASGDWQAWVRAVDVLIELRACSGARLGEVDVVVEHHRSGPTVSSTAAALWWRSQLVPLAESAYVEDPQLWESETEPDEAELSREGGCYGNVADPAAGAS